MQLKKRDTRNVSAARINGLAKLGALALACISPVYAASVTTAPVFTPGNLILSRSVYSGNASTVTVGQPLPPSCPSTAACGTGKATNDGTYPNVFLNAAADGSFGVTAPIFLDQLTTGGTLLSTFPVPTSVLVTSFSSKSELALNLTADGSAITFMGYIAPVNSIDVSNSNTPGVIDPTNPVGINVYRAVAQLDAFGNLSITDTNSYSGNNGRAAVLGSSGFYYTVGNSNNGSGTPANIVSATGVELVTPGTLQATPTEIGNFSIAQYGYTADKAGKDNNYRGLTVFNNTVYVTKGSGGNGINTVYQVGTQGTLPTPATAATTAITILPGFPTSLAKAATAQNPFGLFFANAITLYVADEGDGTTANAATSKVSGLQKWVLVNGTWQLAYTLQNGLNLGQQYSVPNYPTSLNPATDGIRNITGRVNSDGTVTIWGVTSTISASGDQGADPNKMVMIDDVLANTSAITAASETFVDVRDANYGEVLRGVSFTPGTVAPVTPSNLPVTTSGVLFNRRTGLFSTVISLLNNTNSTITGPLSIELSALPANITLTNQTAVIGGFPAINVLAAGTTLGAGQTATVTATFSNPSNAILNFSPVVVAQ